MAFKPGDPRPQGAGRKKGQTNSRPAMKSLRRSLADQGFDLGTELVNLYRNADDQTKLKLLDLASRYTQVAPKTEEKDSDASDQPADSDDATVLQMLSTNG